MVKQLRPGEPATRILLSALAEFLRTRQAWICAAPVILCGALAPLLLPRFALLPGSARLGFSAVGVGAALTAWILWGGVRFFQTKSDLPLHLTRDALSYYLLLPAILLAIRGTFPGDDRLRSSLLCLAGSFACAFLAAKVLAFDAGDDSRVWKTVVRHPRRCLALLILAGTAIYAAAAVSRHLLFQTYTADLGFMDQTVWNTAHGRILEFSVSHGRPTPRYLTGRAELIFLPLAVIYRLLPTPLLLLALQAAALALGAWPLYRIAKRAWGRSEFALSVAAAYLLHPAVMGVNLAAFHSISFAVPLLFWAFDAMLAAQPRTFLLASLLALSCREDAALPLLLLGVLAFARPQLRRQGMAVTALCVVWPVLIVSVLPRLAVAAGWVPPPNPHRPVSEMLGLLSHGPIEMAKMLIRNPALAWTQLTAPANGIYLFRLLFPLAFAPLAAPGLLATCLPSALLNLLSGWGQMNDIQSHYAAPLLPALGGAAACGSASFFSWLHRHPRLHRLREIFPATRAALAPAFAVLIIGSAATAQKAYGRRILPPPAYSHAHLAAMKSIVADTPAHLSVTAPQALGPHMSHRRLLFLWTTPATPDRAIWDMTEGPLWPEDPELEQSHGIRLDNPYPAWLSRRDYGVTRFTDYLIVMDRHADHTAGLARLFLQKPPSGQHLRAVNRLSLEGLRVEWLRAGPRAVAMVNCWWRWGGQGQPPAVDVDILGDRSGFDVRHRPAFGLCPPSLWRRGTIRETFFVQIAQPAEVGSAELRIELNGQVLGQSDPGDLSRPLPIYPLPFASAGR